MKQLFKLSTITLATLSVATLSGCAGFRGAKELNNNATQVVSTNFEGAQSIKSATAMNTQSPDANANFGRVNRVWVNPIPLPKINLNESKSRLPKPIFSKKIDLVLPGKVSLVEVISELQRTKTVDFKISQDIYNQAVSTAQGKVLGGSGGASGAGGASNVEAKPVYVNDFVFSGTLETALDLLASKANISWKWDGSTVHVFRYETKSYYLSALAGKTDSNSSVSLSGSGGGSSGGASSAGSNSSSSTAGVNRSSTSSKWGEISNYLLTLMSPNGTVAMMETSGLINVTDTPSVHAKLEKAIEDLNKIMSKQIYVNMEVYSVSKSKEDNAGIDWNLVWGKAGATQGFTYSSSNTTQGNEFNIGFLSGPLKNSNAILKALSTAGDAALVNQFAITTLNSEPTPVSISRKQAYVKKISSTTVSGSNNAQQQIEPDDILTGIGINLTPKIQPDGKILVEYSMNISELENLETKNLQNNMIIQLPTTTSKNILQRASLRSGQTLVLSGFKQNIASVNGAGIGHPMNILTGGAVVGKNAEQYLVITITPHVAQENN